MATSSPSAASTAAIAIIPVANTDSNNVITRNNSISKSLKPRGSRGRLRALSQSSSVASLANSLSSVGSSVISPISTTATSTTTTTTMLPPVSVQHQLLLQQQSKQQIIGGHQQPLPPPVVGTSASSTLPPPPLTPSHIQAQRSMDSLTASNSSRLNMRDDDPSSLSYVAQLAKHLDQMTLASTSNPNAAASFPIAPAIFIPAIPPPLRITRGNNPPSTSQPSSNSSPAPPAITASSSSLIGEQPLSKPVLKQPLVLSIYPNHHVPITPPSLSPSQVSPPQASPPTMMLQRSLTTVNPPPVPPIPTQFLHNSTLANNTFPTTNSSGSSSNIPPPSLSKNSSRSSLSALPMVPPSTHSTPPHKDPPSSASANHILSTTPPYSDTVDPLHVIQGYMDIPSTLPRSTSNRPHHTRNPSYNSQDNSNNSPSTPSTLPRTNSRKASMERTNSVKSKSSFSSASSGSSNSGSGGGALRTDLTTMLTTYAQQANAVYPNVNEKREEMNLMAMTASTSSATLSSSWVSAANGGGAYNTQTAPLSSPQARNQHQTHHYQHHHFNNNHNSSNNKPGVPAPVFIGQHHQHHHHHHQQHPFQQQVQQQQQQQMQMQYQKSPLYVHPQHGATMTTMHATNSPQQHQQQQVDHPTWKSSPTPLGLNRKDEYVSIDNILIYPSVAPAQQTMVTTHSLIQRRQSGSNLASAAANGGSGERSMFASLKRHHSQHGQHSLQTRPSVDNISDSSSLYSRPSQQSGKSKQSTNVSMAGGGTAGVSKYSQDSLLMMAGQPVPAAGTFVDLNSVPVVDKPLQSRKNSKKGLSRPDGGDDSYAYRGQPSRRESQEQQMLVSMLNQVV